jgi:hypothetical protein
MKPGLQFTYSNGKTYNLHHDGNVYVGNSNTSSGTWKTKTSAANKKNAIHLVIPNDNINEWLPAAYSFNGKRQLVIGLKSGIDNVSSVKPHAYNGQIRLDDKLDLEYALLIQGSMNEYHNEPVHIYGDLKLAEANRLELSLKGVLDNEVLEIKSTGRRKTLDTSVVSVQLQNTAQNIDRLSFIVRTKNRWGSNSPSFRTPARIDFLGNWEPTSASELKFNITAGYSNVEDSQGLDLTIAATYKAVAAGIHVESDLDSGTTVNFLIGGKHEVGDAGTWLVAFGYSKENISATISGSSVVTLDNGSEFMISGDLTITKGHTSFTITAEIEAEYEFDHGTIAIVVKASRERGRLDYSIGLNASLELNSGGVIELQFNLQSGQAPVGLSITYTPGLEDIIQSAGLNINFVNGRPQITASITIGFTVVTGLNNGFRLVPLRS